MSAADPVLERLEDQIRWYGRKSKENQRRFKVFMQLNQYQQNWASYRSTAEALKHEKHLFLGEAGPYRNAESPKPLLADRIEGLVSQEHAKWVFTREETVQARTGWSASTHPTRCWRSPASASVPTCPRAG